MAKQFDSTIKYLVESHPADWLALAGLPVGKRLEVIDADVSSISAAADKVIRVWDPVPYIAHIEFQVSADAILDGRVLFYNVMLRWRHGLPVRSVVRSMEESSFYQMIIEKGFAKGIDKGRAEGIDRGRAEGIDQGRAEGIDKGRAEGIDQGRADEAKSLLLKMATRRYGAPPPQIARQLDVLNDRDRLEALVERVIDASNWEDLFNEK